MKKIKILSLAIAMLFGLGISNTSNDINVASAAGSVSYKSDEEFYAPVKGLKSTELLNKLADILEAEHSKFTSYSDCGNITIYTDTDPKNPNNIILLYKGTSVSGEWDQGSTWNREHVWPQSLSGGLYGESGAGSDIHHIRPTDPGYNTSRGNKLFAELDDSSVTHKGYGNYYSSSYWEPRAEVKGDIARILMYMYTHYSKEVSSNSSFGKAGALAIQSVVYGGSSEAQTPEAQAQSSWDLLMDWNKNDPVGNDGGFEEARNEACASYTGVRNPFIDHPEFARMIWDESYNGPGALLDDDSGSGSGSESTTVEVTSISVSPTSASIDVGDTKQLTSTISPSNATNKSVTWSTSNTTVATVSSSGLVSAIAKGTATITAKSSNNKTATCSITVNEVSSGGGTGGSTTSGDKYVKVTSKPSSWKGTYLIVNEDNKVAFNGGLTTLDATSNNISVDISNDAIAASDTTNKASFTINNSGHIQSKSGYYIGQISNSNGLESSTSTTYTNTLSLNEDSSVNIVSGGAYLRYNATSGQERFRYYKSGSYTNQKAICLYKLQETTVETIKVTNISLNPTSKSINLGETFTINPTITPSNATNKKINWTSSNENVATVDSSGYVTAVGVGTTTITATAADGSGVKATCSVTVNSVYVTNITLNNSSLALQVGNTSNLSASITPSNATNKSVAWSSSNTTVATVSNGVVTAKGVGTATITATAADGSGVKATCSVTVTAAVVKVTAITLSQNTLTLNVDESETLTTTVTPSNATNKGVTWSSSNTTVATVSNGIVTAEGAGTATITATAADGSGVKATCAITVKENTPSGGETFSEGSLTIKRDSFKSGSAYGTIDSWQATTTTGETISGKADIFSTNTYMQFRNNSEPHPYNEDEMPGNISSITINTNSTGTARSWTLYLSDSSILNNTNYSSLGEMHSTLTSIKGGSITFEVDDTHEYKYFYLSLAGGATYVDSIVINYKSSSTPVVPEPEPDEPTPDTPVDPIVPGTPVPVDNNTYFQKVTNVSELVEGHNYVIAAAGSGVALSTAQNNNNRGQTTIIKSTDEKYFQTVSDIQVINLEKGKAEGTYAFNVGNGYLYAASSSSNYLKTESTLSNNSSWTISINSAGVATIKAQGNYTRNVLKYNSQSSLFACYTSGQQDIAIYRVSDANAWMYYWNEMRSQNDGFCSHLRANDETINSLITRYDNLDDYSKTVIIGSTKDSNGVSFVESIEYAKMMLSKSNVKSNIGANLLSNINSNENILLILLIGLMGLVSVVIYYYINKRKYC